MEPTLKLFGMKTTDLRHRLDVALIDLSEYPSTARHVAVMFNSFVEVIEQIRDEVDEKSAHRDVPAEMKKADEEVAARLEALVRDKKLDTAFGRA